MPKAPSWLSSREAAALLDIKLATLYSYTSRGWIESVPGLGGRGRRYDRSSVERLKKRHDARSGHGAVAASALRFGEPSIDTSISDIREDGPYYRGHSAIGLCERGVPFEAVFDLLIEGTLSEDPTWSLQLTAALPAALARLFTPGSAPAESCAQHAALLGVLALQDPARHGASELGEQQRARQVALWLAARAGPYAAGTTQKAGHTTATRRDASSGPQRARGPHAAAGQARHAPTPSDASSVVNPSEGRAQGHRGAARDARRPRRAARVRVQDDSSARGARIAEHVLRSLGSEPTPENIAVIDRVLILCADHELNASTFAARIAASTGADLYACLSAALHTLTGGQHGGASARVEALLREIDHPTRTASVLRERFARGEKTPGFGHPLYPDGDPRARALIALAQQVATRSKRKLPELERVLALCDAMERAGHPRANLDAGLVAVTGALRLPPGAAAALFAIGRLPGWVAHILEQRKQRYILRPRARYVPVSRV